ncbi:MAG: chromate transporter, partial [Chlorobi bacterium]|nr:chromate transporter [Chlorobiota bacterium]
KAFRGIQFAVIGMIAAIVYQYASKMDLEWKSVFIMLVSMGLILGFKLHPALVIGIAAILAMLLF